MMRIFVAGATGAIGRRLVPMLVEAGHEVTGLTRSEAKGRALEQLGAKPAVGDVFDGASLSDLIRAAAPQVVIHELTDIPQVIDPRKYEHQFAGNDRIRREGTRTLVDAAVAAGAKRLIAQSIAFAYPTTGDGLKSEDDPLFLDAPQPWKRSIDALQELEQRVTGTEGIEGVVLRYGHFYGAGTTYAREGHTARLVRQRQFPIVGSGTSVFSFVHVDDAARATVAAVDRGFPGIYNIVDDEPAPVSEWLPIYAAALGAKRPRRAPKILARVLAGSYAVMFMTELRGASNQKAKRELEWRPRYASWRQGFVGDLGQAG